MINLIADFHVHCIFVTILSARSCVLLKMELDPSSKMTNKLERTMKQLDINSQPDDPNVTIESSIVGTLNYFLCQDEKIKAGVLDDVLPEGVKEAWQGLLALLEKGGRKLVAVNEGSIVIKIYCPNAQSIKDLQELAATEAMKAAINKFMEALGKNIQPTIQLFSRRVVRYEKVLRNLA